MAKSEQRQQQRQSQHSPLPIERSFYRIPKFAARMLGIWPEDQRAGGTQLVFAFGFSMVFLGALGENLYGFLNLRTQLVVALEAFCPGSTKALCVLKMGSFFMQHRQWHALVQRLWRMMAATASDKAQATLMKDSSIANRFCVLLFCSGLATNAAFCALPMFIYAYRHWLGLPAEMGLPFNIGAPDLAHRPVWFPIAYLVLVASGFCTVFTCSSVDGFVVSSCLYISGVFRVLQEDIRGIFDEFNGVESFSPAVNALIQRKLIAIIERHNAIFDFCTDLTQRLTVIVLMHFLFAAFVLCSTILDMMLNMDSVSGLSFITNSIAGFLQLYLYCYGGHQVSESSAAVADELYKTEWYKCDARTRKMILMILRRAQRAKTIAVPFFTPSLPAFTAILRTAGSYITLLKTFL